MDLARRLGASVDLLYVASSDEQRHKERESLALPVYVDQPQYEWPAWRQRVLGLLSTYLGDLTTAPPTRVYLVAGLPSEEIVRFGHAHCATVMVLVRQSQLQPGRARLLRRLLETARCPVLVLDAAAANGRCAEGSAYDLRSMLLTAEDNLARTLALACSSQVLQDELEQLVQRVRRLRTGV
jgi:hypothetical protein